VYGYVVYTYVQYIWVERQRDLLTKVETNQAGNVFRILEVTLACVKQQTPF
jgi:hypothetical protein